MGAYRWPLKFLSLVIHEVRSIKISKTNPKIPDAKCNKMCSDYPHKALIGQVIKLSKRPSNGEEVLIYARKGLLPNNMKIINVDLC